MSNETNAGKPAESLEGVVEGLRNVTQELQGIRKDQKKAKEERKESDAEKKARQQIARIRKALEPPEDPKDLIARLDDMFEYLGDRLGNAAKGLKEKMNEKLQEEE